MTEFKHPLEIENLSDKLHRVRLTATEDQLGYIAEALEVPAVKALTGFLEVKRGKKLLFVTGSVTATLERKCVSSLEAMSEEIDESFDLKFNPQPLDYTPNAEIEVDLDEPEPIEGNTLDVARILIDQVILSMALYPRKEGATALEDTGEQPSLSPFAILKSHNLDKGQN